MATTSREPSRDKLAELLAAAMVGPALPVSAVLNYQPSDFGGVSPVVCVLSSGTNRSIPGRGSKLYYAYHKFEVLVFVKDAKQGEGWTPQQVEDRIDDIERIIADVLAANRGKADVPTVPWEIINFEPNRFSGLTKVHPGGLPYWMENITVIAEVKDAA